MNHRQAMQQALEALTMADDQWPCSDGHQEFISAAIAALRAALDQPEPEPVAWYYVEDPFGANEWHWMTDSPESQKCDPRDWTPVYTSQPQRKPLTDEQIDAVWDAWFGAYGLHGTAGPYTRRGFARAIERAHGITGETA